MTEADDAGSLRPGLATANLADAIHAARQRLGLTEIAVAQRLDMPLEQYAAMERGDTPVSAETMVSLCEVLGLQPSELLGGLG